MKKKIFLSLLLIFSLNITACGIVKPTSENKSNSITKEIGDDTETSSKSDINKNTEISETTKTDEDSEMPSESIEVGDGSVTIQIRDSNCKVKLIEDVIMLLDVNNNATVYYQDTGVKTSETSDVYESYLYSWACDSGTLVFNESESTEKSETSEEDTEDEFVDENITSMTLGDKTISFFYRFSTDGNADIYLLEDLDLGSYLGIHIYGKGENLDDVVSLIKQYLL